MRSTITQRAWLAWQCLPRGRNGKPPPIRRLEIAHGLSNAQLRKLILGTTIRPSHDALLKMAAALKCDPVWLSTGEGQSPLAAMLADLSPSPHARGLSPREVTLFEGKAQKLAQRAPIRPRKVGQK